MPKVHKNIEKITKVTAFLQIKQKILKIVIKRSKKKRTKYKGYKKQMESI